MTIYTDRKEAETELATSEPFTHFCPLIIAQCNHNCLCYCPARIVTRGESHYVYKAGCDNAMFIGEET